MVDDDPELAELIRANRQRAGIRLCVVGLIVAACAGAVLGFGLYLDHAQLGAAVRFALPIRIAVAGAIGVAIGVLLIIPGAISLMRGRKRPSTLPRATVRLPR